MVDLLLRLGADVGLVNSHAIVAIDTACSVSGIAPFSPSKEPLFILFLIDI